MKASPHIKNKSSVLYFLYLCYMVLLQGLYHKWIVPIYEYQGFVDSFEINNFFISLLMLLGVLFLVKFESMPSSIFMHIGISLILVPSLVLYSGQGNSLEFIFNTILAFLTIIFVVRNFKLGSVKIFNIKNTFLLNGLIFVSCGIFMGIIVFGGWRFLNFDLSKVYEIRREAESAIPSVFGYLNPIATKTLIPFGIVLSLIYRKKIAALALVFVSIMFFALTTHKSTLFYPLIVLFFYYFGAPKKIIKRILIGLILIVLLGYFDFWMADLYGNDYFGWFASLFLHRAILVPSFLNSIYIDYFESAQVYYWSTSKISLGFVDPPYDMGAPNLIGLYYFGNSDMSANTGWIGGGYAHARCLGVMINSFVIGFLFLFLDAYAKLLGSRLVIALFVLPVITLLTSVDLTDMILTHGLIFAIFILVLLDAKDISIQEKRVLE